MTDKEMILSLSVALHRNQHNGLRVILRGDGSPNCERSMHSPAPPIRPSTQRVITIMLAEEY
jgi:hypothetical protein